MLYLCECIPSLVDKEYKNGQGIRKFLQDPFRWNVTRTLQEFPDSLSVFVFLETESARNCTELQDFCILQTES